MPTPGSVGASATAVPGMDGDHPSAQPVETAIVATSTALVSLVSLSRTLVPPPVPAQFFVCSSRLLAAAPGHVEGLGLLCALPELTD
jgi:hypothetical protein